MANQLVRYSSAMRIGQGFNSYTQEICIDGAVAYDPAVPGGDHYIDETTSPDDISQEISYESRFLENYGEVTSAMCISDYTSITQLFSGNQPGGCCADFEQFSQSDIRFFVQMKVTNQTKMSQDVLKFDSVPNCDSFNFTEVFGDTYISGFLEGGELDILVNVKVFEKEKIPWIRRALQAHFAYSNTRKSEMDHHLLELSNCTDSYEISLSVSQKGGRMVDGDQANYDLASVGLLVSNFSQTVRHTPQRTHAILSKYTALRSFQEQRSGIKLRNYNSTGMYTSLLLKTFILYKTLYAKVFSRLKELESDDAHQWTGGYNASQPVDKDHHDTLLGLEKALQESQWQMTRIRQEVEDIRIDPILATRVNWSHGLLSSTQLYHVLEKPQALLNGYKLPEHLVDHSECGQRTASVSPAPNQRTNQAGSVESRRQNHQNGFTKHLRLDVIHGARCANQNSTPFTRGRPQLRVISNTAEDIYLDKRPPRSPSGRPFMPRAHSTPCDSADRPTHIFPISQNHRAFSEEAYDQVMFPSSGIEPIHIVSETKAVDVCADKGYRRDYHSVDTSTNVHHSNSPGMSLTPKRSDSFPTFAQSSPDDQLFNEELHSEDDGDKTAVATAAAEKTLQGVQSASAIAQIALGLPFEFENHENPQDAND